MLHTQDIIQRVMARDESAMAICEEAGERRVAHAAGEESEGQARRAVL